jgi:hypothetical protein
LNVPETFRNVGHVLSGTRKPKTLPRTWGDAPDRVWCSSRLPTKRSTARYSRTNHPEGSCSPHSI